MTDTVHLLKDSARQTADRMISLIYPLRCPVCDRPVRPYGEDICLPCMKRLKALKPPFCERCGKKISAPSGICTDCSRNDHLLCIEFEKCASVDVGYFLSVDLNRKSEGITAVTAAQYRYRAV